MSALAMLFGKKHIQARAVHETFGWLCTGIPEDH